MEVTVEVIRQDPAVANLPPETCHPDSQGLHKHLQASTRNDNQAIMNIVGIGALSWCPGTLECPVLLRVHGPFPNSEAELRLLFLRAA
jgi:hypothetical protein